MNNAGWIVGQEYYVKGDYIDEPPLYITTTIRFSDNTWDFSDVLHRNVVINFSSVESKTFRVLSKKVALREMFFVGNRSISVKKDCLHINSFMRFLEKEKYMYELRFLTPEIIEEYIEEFKKKGRTKLTLANKLGAIGKLLKEVEIAGYEIDLSQYQDILHSISWAEIKAEMLQNKTPNIPKRIFNKVVETALKDMDDQRLSIKDRMMACLIVILSHTGIRKGELKLLEANKLKDIAILNKNEKAYILEYFTYKTTGKKNGRWTTTIAFRNTIKAYKTLEELSKERRIIGKTNYLYLSRKGKLYSNTSFENMFDLFFYRHQELFEGLKDYERTQVHYQKVGSFLMMQISGKNFPNKSIDSYFFTLNAHQFRVAVANVLKDKVSLQWIREHMNHLDEEMTKHYFRDDEIIKETLYKRASSDGDSLGLDSKNRNDFITNELLEPNLQKAYEEMNKFLRKKRLNIFKDIEEIINTLKYNPLRETVVGVCTKHLGILCERQYRLATFEKWYYLSPTIPNIESFDFTYKRFLDKAKIVQHNKLLVQQDSKYQLDYENEFIALKKFYQNRFLPEYELILTKVKGEGEESFLSSFPQLEVIISNLDEISKEVSTWESALTLKSV
ncbi:hypothetical protein [Robertmurraya sp. P23]|uniref:hypothetical protein n=1 Tax=Robertmurraya sp. P23 TaxID=3436931 RepID=UPI003D987AE6